MAQTSGSYRPQEGDFETPSCRPWAYLISPARKRGQYRRYLHFPSLLEESESNILSDSLKDLEVPNCKLWRRLWRVWSNLFRNWRQGYSSRRACLTVLRDRTQTWDPARPRGFVSGFCLISAVETSNVVVATPQFCSSSNLFDDLVSSPENTSLRAPKQFGRLMGCSASSRSPYFRWCIVMVEECTKPRKI